MAGDRSFKEVSIPVPWGDIHGKWECYVLLGHTSNCPTSDFFKSSSLMNYYTSGKLWGPEDKQPIIFLHGWQDNAGTFDPLVALLPEDLAILCIEFPGHGFSSQYPKVSNCAFLLF